MVYARFIFGVFFTLFSFVWHAVGVPPRRAVFDVLFVHDTAVDGVNVQLNVLEHGYKKVVSHISEAYPGSRFAFATVSRKIQGLPLPGAAPGACFKSWNMFSDDQEAFLRDVQSKLVLREAKGASGNDATLDAMTYLAGGDPQIQWRQRHWGKQEGAYVVRMMILTTDSPFLGTSDWGTQSSRSFLVDMYKCDVTTPVSVADFSQTMQEYRVVPIILAKSGADAEWGQALDTASRNNGWMSRYGQLEHLDEWNSNFDKLVVEALKTAAKKLAPVIAKEPAAATGPIIAEEPAASAGPSIAEEPAASAGPSIAEEPAASAGPSIAEEPAASAGPATEDNDFESVDPKVAEEIAMTWECVYQSGSALVGGMSIPSSDEPKFARFKAEYDAGLCRRVNIGTIFAMVNGADITEGPDNRVFVNGSIVRDTIACRQEDRNGKEAISYSFAYSSIAGRSISWNVEDITLTVYATTFIKSQWEKSSTDVRVNEEWQYDVGQDGAPQNSDYKVDVDVEQKKSTGATHETRTQALNFATLTANAGYSMTRKCQLLWKRKFSSDRNPVNVVDVTKGLKRVSFNGVSVGARFDVFKVVLRELHERSVSTQGAIIVQSVARRLLFIMEVSVSELHYVMQEYVRVLTGGATEAVSQTESVEDYFKIITRYIEQSDNREAAAWNSIRVLYNVIENVHTTSKFPWSNVSFHVEAGTEVAVYREVCSIVLKLVDRFVVLLESDGKVSPPVATQTEEFVSIIKKFSGNHLGSVDINIVVDVLRETDVNVGGRSVIIGSFVKQVLYIVEHQQHLLPSIFVEHGKILGFDTTVATTTYVDGLVEYIVKQRSLKQATTYCVKTLIEVIKRRVTFPRSFPPEVVNIDLNRFWDVSIEQEVHDRILEIVHKVSVRKELVVARNNEHHSFHRLDLVTYMKKSFGGGERVSVDVVIEVLKEVSSWKEDSSLVILKPLARQLIYILEEKQELLLLILEKHGRMLDVRTHVTSTTYLDVVIGYIWRQPDTERAIAYLVKTVIEIIRQEVTLPSDFPKQYVDIDVTLLTNGGVINRVYHGVHRIIRQVLTYKTRDETNSNVPNVHTDVEVIVLLKEVFRSVGGSVDINIMIDVLRKVEISYNVSPIIVSLSKQLVFILEKKPELLPRIIENHGQLYLNIEVTAGVSYINALIEYIERHSQKKEAVAHCIETLIEVIKTNVEFPTTFPPAVVEIDLTSVRDKAVVNRIYFNVVAILRDICKRTELDVVVLLNRLSHVDLWTKESVIIDVLKDAEISGGSEYTTTLVKGFVKQWEYIVTYERNRLPIIIAEHRRRLQIDLSATVRTEGYLNVLIQYIQRQHNKPKATVYVIQTLIEVIRTEIKFPTSFPQEYLVVIDNAVTTDLVVRDVYNVVTKTVNDVVLIVDTPHYRGIEIVDFFTDVIVLLEKEVSLVTMRKRLNYTIVKINEIGVTDAVVVKEDLDITHMVSVIVKKIGVEINTGAVVDINGMFGGLLEDLSVSLLTRSLQWHVDFILDVTHQGPSGVVTVGVDDFSVLFRLIRRQVRTLAIRGHGEVVQFINILRKGFNPEFVSVESGVDVSITTSVNHETPGGIFTKIHNTIQSVLVWDGEVYHTPVIPVGKPGSEFILFIDDLVAVLEKDVSNEDLRIRIHYLFNTVVEGFHVKGGNGIVFNETWDVKTAIIEILKHIAVEFKEKTLVEVNYEASALLYDISVVLLKVDVEELGVTVISTLKELSWANEVEVATIEGTYTFGQDFSSVLRIIRTYLSVASSKGHREFSEVVKKLRISLRRRWFGGVLDLGTVPSRHWVDIEDSKTSVFEVTHNFFVTVLDTNVDWIKKTHNGHTVIPSGNEDFVILLKRLSETELFRKDIIIIDVLKDIIEIPATVEGDGYLIVRALVRQLIYILENERDQLSFIFTEHIKELNIGGTTTVTTSAGYLNLLIQYIETQSKRNQAVGHCIQVLIEVIRKRIQFPPTFPKVYVDIDTTKLTSDTVIQSEVHVEVTNVVSSVVLVLNAGDYAGREIVDVYTDLIALLEKDVSLSHIEMEKRLRHVLVEIIQLDTTTPHGPVPKVDGDLQITYLIAQIVERIDILVKREALVDINIWGASLFRWISEGLIRERPEVLLVSLENTFVSSSPRTTTIGHINDSVIFRFIRREYRKRAIRGSDVVTFVEGVQTHLKQTFGITVDVDVGVNVVLTEGQEQEVSGGVFTHLRNVIHGAVVWDGHSVAVVPYGTPRVGTEVIRCIEDFIVILEKDVTDVDTRKRLGVFFNVIVNAFTVTTSDTTVITSSDINENWDTKRIVVEIFKRIGREFREKAVVQVNYEASALFLDISVLLSQMGVEELRETIKVAIDELSWESEILTVTGSHTFGKELAVILRVIHKRLTLASFNGEKRVLEIIRKLIAIIRRRSYKTTLSLEDDISVNPPMRKWALTEDKLGVFQVTHTALVYVLHLDVKSLGLLPVFHEGNYVGRQVVELLIDVNALLGKDGTVTVAKKRLLYLLHVMTRQLKVAYNDVSFPHYHENMDVRDLVRIILQTVGVELERRAVVEVNIVTGALLKDLSIALEHNDSRRIVEVVTSVFNLDNTVVSKVTTGFGGSLTDLFSIIGLIEVGIEHILVHKGVSETVLVIERCREELRAEFDFVSQRSDEEHVSHTFVEASEFDLGIFSVLHGAFRVVLNWDATSLDVNKVTTITHKGWTCLPPTGPGLNTFKEIPSFISTILETKGICDAIPKMAVDKSFLNNMVSLGDDFKTVAMEDMLVVCRNATAEDETLYKQSESSSSLMKKAVETDWSGAARLLKAAFARYPRDIVCHLATDTKVTNGEATPESPTTVSVVCEKTSQESIVRHFSAVMQVRTTSSSFSREELTFRPRDTVICGVSDGLAVVHRWGGFSFTSDTRGVWANGRYTIFKMAVERKVFNVNMDVCSMDPMFFKLLVEEGLVAQDMKCCLTAANGSVLGWNEDASATPTIVCNSKREIRHRLVIVPHFFREERFDEKYLTTLFYYRRYRDAFQRQTPFVILRYGDDDTITARQSLRCLLQIKSFNSFVLSRVVSVKDARRRNCFAVSHRVLHESLSGTAIRLPRGVTGYGAVCMDLGVSQDAVSAVTTAAASAAVASGMEIYWNVGAAKEEDRILLEPGATPEDLAVSGLKRSCTPLVDLNVPKLDSCLFDRASPFISKSHILKTLAPMESLLPRKYRAEMGNSRGCHILQSEDKDCKGQGCALVTSGVVCRMKHVYKLYRGAAFASVKASFDYSTSEGHYDLKRLCTNETTTTSSVTIHDYDIVAHLLGFQIENVVIRTLTVANSVVKALLKVFKDGRKPTTTTTTTTTTQASAPVAEILPVVASAFAGALLLGGVGYFLARKRPEVPEEAEAEFDLSRTTPAYDDRQTVAQCDLEDFV